VLSPRTAGARVDSALAHRGAALWPSRVAFAWNGRRRTYGELAGRVQRLSGVFAAAGVRAGSRIALLTVNTPEALETAFAASRLGACVVPLNARPAPAEIRFQVEDAGAGHAVIHPLLESLARSSGLPRLAHWVIGEELDTRLDGPPNRARRGPATRPRSSSCTRLGPPAEGLPAHEPWMGGRHRHAVHAFDVTSEDRLLATLPLFHVAGYGTVLAHLAVGARRDGTGPRAGPRAVRRDRARRGRHQR
jgi:acyl-CoA synthetase (AMP-forming)/AMP-acid ligase II